MNTNRVVHDWLLEHKPEAANHDATNCSFCVEKASTEENKVAEDKIFTQEQHEQLLAAAVESAISEATSKMDAEVLRLNEKVEELEMATEGKDQTIDELKASIEERDEKARLAELAAERRELVRAKANFTDEQLDARAESWAKMEEDEFNAYLEDIEAVAKASKSDTTPPSIFESTRETASEGDELAVLKGILSGNLAGMGG